MNEIIRKSLGKEVSITTKSEVLTPMQFIIDWRKSVSNARRRVYLECMSFEYGHAPGLIQQAMYEAAYNGLDVRVNIDAFSDATFNDEIKWVSRFGGRKRQETLQELDKDMKMGLTEAGVKLNTLNPNFKKFGLTLPAKAFPFIGRNHTKIFIVDNVAWFGGVNVATDHFEKADFLVKFTDSRIVEPLVELFQAVNESKPEQDFMKSLTPNYALLVDRGDAKKSLILNRAEDLVERSSESVEYLSQLPPTGKLLERIMERAKSGVNVSVVISNESEYQSNSIPFGLLMKREFNLFKKRIKGLTNIQVFHYSEGKVHGKLLILDGKIAVFGSHNFSESGVKAGTQEASIETTDPRLIPELRATLNSIKNGSFERGLKKT